jgi:hypothetical protein
MAASLSELGVPEPIQGRLLGLFLRKLLLPQRAGLGLGLPLFLGLGLPFGVGKDALPDRSECAAPELSGKA